ncbi:MAG: hypothetical protein JF565_02205 [Propionibacteriales bacterium]|nr:hypothetical protein [Propionibacteriales bacterium]
MSTALAATLAACAGAAATLLLVAVVALLTRRRRRRVDLEAMLAASQREVDDLRHRLDELTGGRPAYLEELFAAPSTPSAPQQAEFVITHVGESGLDPARLPDDAVAVPDRLVLSATVGEPLVKVAAFSHGVRRALSARSRNRIWFEMRSEVRAARKRRRRLVKDYLRETRAQERATEGLA